MILILRGFAVAALAVGTLLFAAALVTGLVGRDDTVPTITADSETLEIPCDYTEDQLLAGVTAWDDSDGDLTSQIVVGSFTRFIELGVCDLSYVVFNSAGHMDTLTRRIRFTDYRSPQFALAEPLCFAEGSTNNTEVRSLFTASDMLDGDLTDWITYVETSASYDTPGDYTITMEVSNSFGDTVSYAFPIHIYQLGSQDFDISLTTPLVYVDQGSSFDPMAYVASVTDENGDGYDPALLSATSTVDTATPGIYEVHYEIGGAFQEVEGTEGLISSIEDDSLYGQMWLTVIVQRVPE